jgi:hypothetical protein
LGPSHAAKVTKCCHVDRAKLRNGCVNSRGQRTQNTRDVLFENVVTFRLNRRELFRRESAAAGVREEAIDDSGNVSHMKSRGGYPRRTGIPLLLRQRLNDLADALADLKQDVRDRLKDGRNAIDGTALPPSNMWTGYATA